MTDRSGDNNLSYELEIKVRNLISELIQPSLLKLKNTEKLQTKLKKSQNFIKEKFNNLDARIEYVDSKIFSLDPINKRISDLSFKATSIELKAQSDHEKLINELEVFSSTIGTLSSQIFSLFNQYELLKKDLKNYNLNFIELKTFIENKVNDIRKEIKDPFVTQIEMTAALESRIIQFEKNLNFVKSEILGIEYIIKKNERDISKNLDMVETQSNSIEISKKKLMEDLDTIKKAQASFTSFAENNQAAFREQIENKLAENFCTLNDKILKILGYILTEPRYKKKIQEIQATNKSISSLENKTNRSSYDEKLLKSVEFHPKPSDSVSSSLKNSQEKIQNSENAKKSDETPTDSKEHPESYNFTDHNQPTNLKVENQILLVNKIPQPSHKEINSLKLIENQKIPEPITIGIPDIADTESSKDLSLTPSNKIEKAQETIADPLSEQREISTNPYYETLIEEIQDHSEKLTQDISIIDQKISQIQVKIEDNYQSSINDFKKLEEILKKSMDEVNLHIENELKNWIKDFIASSFQQIVQNIGDMDTKRNQDIIKALQNYEELKNLLKQSSYEFMSYVSGKKRESNDLKLEFKRIYAKLEELSKNEGFFYTSIDKLNYTARVIKNAMVLINSIQLQDETDRQSLIIAANKENEVKRRSSLTPKPHTSTDKNCEACQNFGPQVLLALKAVFSNSPPMTLNEKQTDRTELLQKQQKLLTKIDLEESKTIETDLKINSRSLTPELPSINKKKL